MKQKALTTINISLILIAAILVLNLFGHRIPSIGQASYWLDQSEPVCLTGFKDQISVFDPDQCCLEIQRQSGCEIWNTELVVEGEKYEVSQWCHSGEGTIEVYTNNKMYNYCQKEGYLNYRLI